MVDFRTLRTFEMYTSHSCSAIRVTGFFVVVVSNVLHMVIFERNVDYFIRIRHRSGRRTIPIYVPHCV